MPLTTVVEVSSTSQAWSGQSAVIRPEGCQWSPGTALNQYRVSHSVPFHSHTTSPLVRVKKGPTGDHVH